TQYGSAKTPAEVPTYSCRCARLSCAGSGHRDKNRRALPRRGPHLAVTAERLRAEPHPHETLALVCRRRIEPGPVVADPQRQPRTVGFELHIDVRAPGVPGRVVEGFLEDQEDVAADVHTQSEVVILGG